MKAVLFGTGWRAMFFVRIAEMVPSLLTITSVYTHAEERAEEMRARGLNASADLNEVLSAEHDAVIVASGKNGFYEMMMKLKERGEFIISETSFLPLSDRELATLEDAKGATAEQYQFTPLYASIIASLPMIGRIDQVYISGLHNHHAASIARAVLGIDDEIPELLGSADYGSRMLKTGERKGMDTAGEMEDYTRSLRMLKFSKGLFINDFSSNQYHSYFYGKRIEIRGEKGIITEQGVNTVDDNNFPVFLPFVFHRDISVGNGSMTLTHVSLGERTVFINPFYPENLNDDEIGIALLLKNIEEGLQYPSVRDGILDAKLGKML